MKAYPIIECVDWTNNSVHVVKGYTQADLRLRGLTVVHDLLVLSKEIEADPNVWYRINIGYRLNRKGGEWNFAPLHGYFAIQKPADKKAFLLEQIHTNYPYLLL